MAKPFTIDCAKCGTELAFDTEEVIGLDEFIDSQCDDARDEGRADRGPGDIDLANYFDTRPFKELARAIRTGNRDEAEYQLDQLAELFGEAAIEYVQQGRFFQRERNPA